MRLLVVGAGSIGSVVAEAAKSMRGLEGVDVTDAVHERARALAARVGGEAVDLATGIARAGIVVEAASQKAVAEVAPRALEAGKDVVVLSLGALADDALRARLEAASAKSGARVHVPSGAVGALDALRAAREGGLDEVTLTTAKPPAGFGLADVDAPRTLFDGPAREAVVRYPKNVNVAAAVALAGIGFDRTRVRIVADPALTENTHTVEARGGFGSLRFRVENRPFPDHPATSRLAALAAVALVRRLVEPSTLA